MYGISCEVDYSEIYRYSLLFDKERGASAFSADII